MELIPLVSIVILNYNGLKYIRECLNSVLGLDYPNYEVIFVDNYSDDNSVEYVNKNYEKIKIVQLKKNFGYAKGNNIGIKKAKGDFIALLNIDTIVDKNWLTELLNTAKESKINGIIGSKIYYYDRKKIINFAGSICDKYGNTQHIGNFHKDSEEINKEKKIFYACGASLLLRREFIEKAGLFDPYYFMYYEDVDISWRAWIFGYNVVFSPKSFIFHKIGGINKISHSKLYLSERNELRTILKNYKLKTLGRILPNYLLIRILKIFRYRKHEGNLSVLLFLAYLKAILWNILNFGSLIKYRIFIQKNRVRNDCFILALLNYLRRSCYNLSH